jgi:hypothetical protein
MVNVELAKVDPSVSVLCDVHNTLVRPLAFLLPDFSLT